MSSSRKPKAPSEGAPPDDFEAIWAADETPAKYEANAPINLRSIATSALSLPGHRKSTKGKPGAEGTFMQQLSGCNASGLKTNQSASSPSAIKMFEKIQRQLTVPTTIDSSGFPMDTIDGNNGTRQKQRIQEKLDAVRARSLRNAQIFQKMENKGKVNVTTDEEGKELSFASFDDPNIDVITSINEVEDSATGSTAKGKRLDQLFDRNTSQDVVMTPATNKTASSNEKRPSSAELVAQTTAPENESSHFMYVGYSQFGVDAHKVLKLCGHNSIPAPDRRKGEILVRINASLVSATDCAIRRGEWKDMKLDPYIIPGIAFVGKAMGREKKRTRASSSNIEPGDSVLALVREGANARYIALEKKCLIKVPPQLDAERVVCLSETYLTAFQALHLGQRGGMRYRDNSLQGRSILIMNGYSPLGKAIIELARLSGASICYGLISDNPKNTKDGMGTSSVEMHQRFKKLEQWGAIPLSSDPQDWLTLIGRQIDIFVTTYDPNEEDRGDNEITADHWKALKKDGQVHVVCSLPGMSEVEQRNMILGSQPSNKAIDTKAFRLPSCRPGGREKMADRAVYYNLFDSYMGDRLSKVTARKDLEHLIKLMEADLIHPQVAERVSLSKIAKAQRTLEHNKITGEGHLVCIPWLREKPKEQQKSTTKKQAKDVQKDVKYEV
jgi:NADPH:quinone reductase-like Zn-dependent oxidoreductase